MRWGKGRDTRSLTTGQKVWVRHFCVLPRKVDGYWFWMEEIEVEAEVCGNARTGFWFYYNVSSGDFHTSDPRRIPEETRKEMGLDW